MHVSCINKVLSTRGSGDKITSRLGEDCGLELQSRVPSQEASGRCDIRRDSGGRRECE